MPLFCFVTSLLVIGLILFLVCYFTHFARYIILIFSDVDDGIEVEEEDIGMQVEEARGGVMELHQQELDWLKQDETDWNERKDPLRNNANDSNENENNANDSNANDGNANDSNATDSNANDANEVNVDDMEESQSDYTMVVVTEECEHVRAWITRQLLIARASVLGDGVDFGHYKKTMGKAKMADLIAFRRAEELFRVFSLPVSIPHFALSSMYRVMYEEDHLTPCFMFTETLTGSFVGCATTLCFKPNTAFPCRSF
jgi:hypothetical protein